MLGAMGATGIMGAKQGSDGNDEVGALMPHAPRIVSFRYMAMCYISFRYIPN